MFMVFIMTSVGFVNVVVTIVITIITTIVITITTITITTITIIINAIDVTIIGVIMVFIALTTITIIATIIIASGFIIVNTMNLIGGTIGYLMVIIIANDGYFVEMHTDSKKDNIITTEDNSAVIIIDRNLEDLFLFGCWVPDLVVETYIYLIF